MKTIYTIPAPYNEGMIDVYGDPENAWYEWRIIDKAGRIVQDTASDGGRQCGQAEIALRDALLFASDLS